jgi:outer membrane protein OmpA-like peptidoglycan-associated protein
MPPRRLVLALVALATSLLAAEASAQVDRETEHLVHLDLRGGAMVTEDQRQELRLDDAGLEGRLAGGLRPLPWLAGELSIGVTVVGGEGGAGGVLDGSLGLRAMPRVDRLTPFAAVSAGVGLTGSVVVPVLRGEAGFWLDVNPEWSVGPALAVTHVVWDDGPRRTSDAVFVGGGLSVAYRPVAPAAPPPARTVVRVQERTRLVRAHAPTLPLPPPSDPAELLRLVDRAVPAATTRAITTLVPPLLFEHDRTELSTCGEASLHDVLALVAEAPPDARFVVEGHADATGDEPYNRELARRRAAAIRDFLVSHGVDPSRVETRAVGEGEPLVRGEDSRSLSLNRRAVVHVVTSPAPSPALPPAALADDAPPGGL